ncbi:MAG: DUF1592 domain-containing protein [Armatimonadetes bacterium]|nr:DUF1592 domain-containing protein [Armatimonadota bacterium]
MSNGKGHSVGRRFSAYPLSPSLSPMTSFLTPFLTQRGRTALLYLLPTATLAVAVAGVSLTAAAKPPAAPKKPTNAAPTFARDVAPLVDKYCIGCHTADAPSGGVVLAGLTKTNTLMKNRKDWEQVASNISSKHMPPMGMPAPSDAEREKLVAHIEGLYSAIDCKINDPGRVTMRRLNRAEYNNTVRDLTGLDLRLSDDFPSDDVGYGFDNIGDVLSLSPILMEKYLSAAGKIAQATVKAPEDMIAGRTWEGSKLAAFGGFDAPGTEGRALFSAGTVAVPYAFPLPGKYTIRVKTWQQKAGDGDAEVRIEIGGKEIKTLPVSATDSRKPQTLVVETFVQGGEQPVGATFTNDYYREKDPNPALNGDRNLFIESIEVAGPNNVDTATLAKLAAASPAQTRLFAPGKSATGETERARKILRAFALRAFRRPPTLAETDRLVSLYGIARKNKESFERGIQLGMQGILASPNFLYRAERETGETRDLTDYELAARLSYFLWSSTPDDTLLTLAATKQLHKPEVLKAQAKRMLASPKAVALTDNFAGQWLQLRKLDRVSPDPTQFPQWDESLRSAMREETRRYFSAVVREDRSVLEFLDSDWTYLNGRLAKHYGVTNVTGDKFVRVKLSGGRRGGVLTQASVLTITSNPTRTSPVKRGKWVLDNLLNTPPPPPPPGVGELPDDAKGKEALTGTLRERLEKHRADPSCASCHSRMDPIGFGLENFDAIGAWRERDGTAAIDATGTLPDGKSFDGSGQLRKVLAGKKLLFTKAMTEKLLTYAIGRGVESTDRCNVGDMADTVAAKQYRFSAVVEQIVLSEPFRKRRTAPGDIIAPKRGAKTASIR